MFRTDAAIRAVPLFDGHECFVVDDALQDPQGWRNWAIERRDEFAQRPYAYPGIELDLPADALASISEHFAQRFRQRLGGRRTLGAAARLSLATRQPPELEPRQWFCHRDSAHVAPEHCLAASVLYLFDDPALGGTGFYRPRRSAEETAWLVHECSTLPADEFSARHPEIAPAYMTDSNAWFERVAQVPARFNRLIFFNGGVFHSADLRQPQSLSPDPARGRLTMNGFFTCRRLAR